MQIYLKDADGTEVRWRSKKAACFGFTYENSHEFCQQDVFKCVPGKRVTGVSVIGNQVIIYTENTDS